MDVHVGAAERIGRLAPALRAGPPRQDFQRQQRPQRQRRVDANRGALQRRAAEPWPDDHVAFSQVVLNLHQPMLLYSNCCTPRLLHAGARDARDLYPYNLYLYTFTWETFSLRTCVSRGGLHGQHRVDVRELVPVDLQPHRRRGHRQVARCLLELGHPDADASTWRSRRRSHRPLWNRQAGNGEAF